MSRSVRGFWVTTVAVTLAASCTVGGATAAAAPPAAELRLNQLQVIASHNSYHRELSRAEKDVQRTRDPNWWNLEYSHAALTTQFAEQRVRSVELDLFPDPAGGLYTAPLVRRDAGLGPLTDPALARPGIKVLHWADHDYGSVCPTLVGCLRELRSWSQANPGHVPIPVLLELKVTDPALEKRGGAVSPRWDTARLDELDAEIRAVLGDRLITPDDVRRPGRTLEQSVLAGGWPTLSRARGRFLFLMDNAGAEYSEPYLRGRPNLEGRVLFTNAVPGRPDAAFVKRNNPTGQEARVIAELVRRGYYVRTRSDEPFAEASSGDTGRLTAALASGAQVVSTDFPAPGLAARYGSEYVARLPGWAVARCNPVTTGPATPRCGRPLEPAPR